VCHFVDSENYIFGKFDTFVKRITKIADMLSTMESFSGLEDARIEGLEATVLQYKSLVDMVKKKNYDILDHRKKEVRYSVDVWCHPKIWMFLVQGQSRPEKIQKLLIYNF